MLMWETYEADFTSYIYKQLAWLSIAKSNIFRILQKDFDINKLIIRTHADIINFQNQDSIF